MNAENVAHGLVYGYGYRVVVDPPEPFIGCSQNFLETVFAFLKRIFGLFAQGDVAEHHHGTDDLVFFTLGHTGVGSVEICTIFAPENLISSKCGDSFGVGQIDRAFLLQVGCAIRIRMVNQFVYKMIQNFFRGKTEHFLRRFIDIGTPSLGIGAENAFGHRLQNQAAVFLGLSEFFGPLRKQPFQIRFVTHQFCFGFPDIFHGIIPLYPLR